MNESFEHRQAAAVQRIKRHQFGTLIVGSILISLFLVYVALSLYASSGTLQLDLSRPGYAEARREVTRESEVFKGFSSSGSIDAEVLDEFDAMYQQKAKEAASVDAFGGDALSDHAMQLDR